MLIFLFSCFSFVLILKSISLKPLIQIDLLGSLIHFIEMVVKLVSSGAALSVPLILVPGHAKTKGNSMAAAAGVENEVDYVGISLLDLPDLVLESILERLSPAELINLAGVCTCLRDKCRGDHIWERQFKKKWGRVIGKSAFREWRSSVLSNKRRRSNLSQSSNYEGVIGSVSSFWPLTSRSPKLGSSRSKSDGSWCFDSSVMAWYKSLQEGNYWFPAQVYNRENGHGFMLSCYDAQVSYNSRTDTFQARYSSRGRRTIEENISWDRLRIPPLDTPFVLHVSNCLDDLNPGDHFEIQWRRNGKYPYGWWYGVVGHLSSCGGDENQCQCHESDMVVLEFNHYPPESRWRRAKISRKCHHEEGNEADGFYGGIRKLYNNQEISKWKSIWPKGASWTPGEIGTIPSVDELGG